MLLLEEVNKDLLKSTALRFVNKLDISDYEDYKAWLKLIVVSGKPRIPPELKIDYKQLNNSLSMLVDYEKTASKFSDPEQKYLKFIISSGHNVLKRVGSEHLISLIDILYKGSGSTAKSKTNEIKIGNYI
jgi:DNA-binding MurR/RpiR family transcriptional regulator